MDLIYREGTDLPLDHLAELFELLGWGWQVPNLDRLVSGSTWAVSAWDSARLVGFARVLSDDVRESVLHDVGVHPDYQGFGIGTALVERVIARFGHTRILLTRRSELDAFYARFGFRLMDRAMERRY